MSGECNICGFYGHVESNCDADEPDDPTAPRLVVRSVPASVTRSRVVDLLATLGIDALDVTRYSGVLIGYDAIRCQVVARDDNGEVYLNETGDEIATHDICIPIVETP